MKRRSTKLPNFGTEPLLVEPPAALGDLKPVLDAGTELVKRYNGGENFANGEYEHWFDQFGDVVVRCFGPRSLAATYFQDFQRLDRLLEMMAEKRKLAQIVEGEGRQPPVDPRVESDSGDKLIDRLRSEVATLGEWVRKLERQIRKKPL